MYLSLNTYICICLTDRSKSFVVLFGVKQAANSVFLTNSHSFARLHAILMQMFVYVPATTVHVQPKSPRIWLCCSFLSAVSWLNKYESHEPNTELLHTYARNIFFHFHSDTEHERRDFSTVPRPFVKSPFHLVAIASIHVFFVHVPKCTYVMQPDFKHELNIAPVFFHHQHVHFVRMHPKSYFTAYKA